MADFKPFASKVHERFKELSKNELYVTVQDRDALWDHYLKSFPVGTDPIYLKETEHTCSCCRNFIKNLGNVVGIDNGQIISVWHNLSDLEYPYNVVAESMAKFVEFNAITGIYRGSEPSYGAATTRADSPKGTINFNHFHGKLDNKHYSKQVDKLVGDVNTIAGVFKRGLTEITVDSLNTIIDLIGSNALYRGQEHLVSILEFKKIQDKYFHAHNPNMILWSNVHSHVARFRNTVIGTLATDLSDGVDMEQAVKSFETKVAPQNYKRPTALVTKGMIDQALKTIQELNLEPALKRRFAKISDVSVNNVLWVNNSTKSKMKDGIAGILEGEIVSKQGAFADKTQPITIEDFMTKVLPTASGLEVFMKNSFQKNLVSLTAPVDSNVAPLFKWDNNFAWSYNGNITDAIKEKVKKAGGNIQADIRVSLAWFNHDDLDLHCHGPMGHVYFGNKMGILDVDMNAGGGTTREPVENLAFMKPRDGVYNIQVNQFAKRETSNVGFTLELEYDGIIQEFSYDRAVAGTLSTIQFNVKQGKLVNLMVNNSDLKQRGITQNVWGVKTEQFIKINTVMYSPNFWNDKAIGNKHWFFLLDECKNDEPTRGIYNEFLRSDLEQYRKVFEVLGNKTKCEPSDDQLSGLGFSSTTPNEVTVRVTDKKATKLYTIKF